MAANEITTGELPAAILSPVTFEPSVSDSAELTPAPEPALATYSTPVDVPDQVLETTPSTPAATETPVITEIPAVPAPETLQTPEATNELNIDSATAIEPSPETTPAPETLQTPEATNELNPDFAVATVPSPEITPEPALPVSSLPVVEPAPTPEPTLTTYPMPAAVPGQVLEAAPSAPAASDYPVITEAPAIPIPPDSETAKKATDETNPDSTL
ncbi:MAG: hypothetical protein ABSB38_01330 [Dehalococcoidia bacterium]|jgi:hypothetical protein